jgi:hypothetical protein
MALVAVMTIPPGGTEVPVGAAARAAGAANEVGAGGAYSAAIPDATPRAALRRAPPIGEPVAPAAAERVGARGAEEDMSQATTGAARSAAAAAAATTTRASCARGGAS